MLLSIITINYNNLVGLRRTVASVLAQSYKDFEYIVIDGASTDGSYEFLAQHSGIDQWISEPDKGVFQAMNKGIQHAHGEYCLFLNSGDTLFAPDSLEGVVGYLGESDFYTGAVTYLDNVFALTVKGEILVEGSNGICLRLGYPDLFRNIGKQLGRDIAVYRLNILQYGNQRFLSLTMDG